MNLSTIKERIFNKTWKRCLILFIIIFLIIALGGAISIGYLDNIITQNQVHSIETNITDKYYGDGMQGDYYLVTTDDNKTFSIIEKGDGYGKKMWDNIQVGHRYRLIIQDGDPMSPNKFSHILQVHNDTS